MVLSILILAISLSLDALGVGLTYGMRKINIPLFSKLIICLFSIVYSTIALLMGSSLQSYLSPNIAKKFGILILLLMGSWITIQALIKKKENIHKINYEIKEKTLINLVIKSLGITIQVIKNPVDSDIDKSGIIDIKESLLLGFALSVDAIGVGIGSALTGFHSMIIPFAVGLFQLCFLCTGLFLGKKCASIEMKNKKIFSIIPGILLICLAIARV